MEERTLTLPDGHPLFFRVWNTEDAKATLHILHGMAEHSARYDHFARYMNSLGFVVYAQDHRGHGCTKAEDEKGWFSEHDGWKLVCSDSWALDKLISQEHQYLPHFLMGHSMGSFMARSVLGMHPDAFDAVIIMGTGASQGIIGRIGRMIAKHNAAVSGGRMPDEKMNVLAFGSYAKHFPGEGNFGWLTKDKTEVRKYEDDPLCGFTCSSAFFMDLLEGIEMANDRKLAENISNDLPMLIISGEDDPVGGYGKGVRKVHKLYKDAGLSPRLKLFPKDRHELLNETDREAVMDEIGAFCQDVLRRIDEE